MKTLPTLRQLSYLAALAEHRHFTKAAAACHTTQSALSAGLLELERLMGATLIERGRRGVLFTPLGEAILARGRALLVQAEELADLAAAAKAPLSGVRRLGVIPTIAPYLLPAALSRLRETYPALKLRLREDLTRNLLAQLTAGELEAALIALPYPTEGFSILELGRDPFLFVARPDHPLARQKSLTADQLGQADNLILLEEGHCLRDHALAACRLARAPQGLDRGILASGLTTLVQMVASGLGATLLPKLAILGGALSGTDLVARPLAKDAPVRILALAWRASAPNPQEFHLLARSLSPAAETKS
ncbi:MAG: hydrogen peroxide-inducible genes activator [Rhodospirillales bacterium]|nr:hydrogen peroxide-inducible genes activator [Rhodospirillales bacterium]